MLKIFYVTDIHGSEICWKKFLNAGAFYKADVVILGGDITGKAMVPIVQRSDGTWDASLQDHHQALESEDAIVEFETRVMNRGYYPIRISEEEYRHMQEDEDAVDKRFKQAMVEGTERWISMVEDKLAGTGIRAIACPANDDMFEIDELLKHTSYLETGDEDHPMEIDGFKIISMGWTNPTPWNTFREAEEPELAKRIDRALEHAGEPESTILNFHAPPYGSKLDNAPALNADLTYKSGGQALRPVGSTAVLEAIKRFQPVLSLHGHIHESKGAARIGKTLALNPGSSYEEGILQAAVVNVDPKKRKVKNYQLVNG
ncbi:MAG: metallophosphoesterase [Actinomycetota bacterium]|nr:metallophosphoesterase [Actinomycetota bacterium]